MVEPAVETPLSAPIAAALAAIEAGTPFCWSYDAYGSGRNRYQLEWHAERGTFHEIDWFSDLSGVEVRSASDISREAVIKHLRHALAQPS